MQTRRLTPADLETAAQILRQGGLVAFPTETVYGLGADATNARAVAAIFVAKDRPRFNPLIVHVQDLDQARHYAEFPAAALALARAFWPGPLTLLLEARPGTAIAPITRAGLDRIALRVPRHPVARALLAAAGIPVAAPSANRSGRISPTRAEHVLATLDGRIDAVLDAGACPVGLESTIVGFEPDGPVLHRPGGIPAEAIEALLGHRLAAPDAGTVAAPGQIASHYAPAARLRLDADAPLPGEAWLGFGPDFVDAPQVNLSASGDLVEAAANLFAALHDIDRLALHESLHGIAVASIPQTGLGRAINDRLQRAAAPRPPGA